MRTTAWLGLVLLVPLALPALAQNDPATLVVGTMVPTAALGLHPAISAVRERFPACQTSAMHTLEMPLETGTDRPDQIALITATCRRVPTQFLRIQIDRGTVIEQVLLAQLSADDAEGLVAEPATRRLFLRRPGLDRLEEVPWQRMVREQLLRNRIPLREHAPLLLPAVPSGPAPLVAALSARPAPAVAPVAPETVAMPSPASPRDEAALRAAITAELRPQLLAEARAAVAAELQQRLDQTRAIVEGLQEQLRQRDAELATVRGMAEGAADRREELRRQALAARAAADLATRLAAEASAQAQAAEAALRHAEAAAR